MPWARRFRELGVVGKKELGELDKIDVVPREPASGAWRSCPRWPRRSSAARAHG